MHLADACIQSDLQCIQFIYFFCQYMCSLGIEPTTFALLMQCSTTEPQEQDLSCFPVILVIQPFQLVPKATFLIFKIFNWIFIWFHISFISINKTVFNNCIYIKW